MKNILYLCLTLLAACAGAEPTPDDSPAKLTQPAVEQMSAAAALEAMQGSWAGPWIFLDGNGQPINDAPFEAKVEIAGERFWLYAPDREPLELTIKLSDGFDPPFIDLSDAKAPGEPLLGVYALSGDVLIICSGRQRPNGVLPCNGPSQWLLTLTSVDKAEARP
jgi:uncharacterized protein (TIGR03067 family)